MNKHSIIFTLLGTVLVVGVLAGVYSLTQANTSQGTDEEIATLATCLTDAGAKFYGAYWCSHCQDQKADFGKAVDLLPYVECSTPDGKGQTQVCSDAGITGYPTWVFADGRQASGHIGLASLAEVTGCPVPAALIENA